MSDEGAGFADASVLFTCASGPSESVTCDGKDNSIEFSARNSTVGITL
jgi:hypothetical protein